MSKRIVVIGHVDHGKTTLINAINAVYGKELDTPEGGAVACIRVGLQKYEFFDYPGLWDYQEKLKSFDGVVLCVAATDGPMPHTRAMMEQCRDLGMKKLVVFTNKMDAIDYEELADLVEEATIEIINEHGIDGKKCPIVRGSALEAMENPKGKWADPIKQLTKIVAKVF